jgi:UDP-glucose 4-epimerase
MSGGYIENVNSKVELWQMNLVNGNLSECFERHKFDYVYHFAAYAAEGLSPFIRSYNYQNNLVATSRVINECIKHNVKRLYLILFSCINNHNVK